MAWDPLLTLLFCFPQVVSLRRFDEKGEPEDSDSPGEPGHSRESNSASYHFGRPCKYYPRTGQAAQGLSSEVSFCQISFLSFGVGWT